MLERERQSTSVDVQQDGKVLTVQRHEYVGGDGSSA